MKTFKKNNLVIEEAFLGEMNALFNEKKPQIETEIEQKIQKVQIFKVFMLFLSNFDTIAGLQSVKGSTRKEMAVQEASSRDKCNLV